MRTLFFTEQLFREGDMLVAYCPELDVSSCGRTVAESRANLGTALHLFLEEAAKMGTLKDILDEAGYDTDDTVMLSPMISIDRKEMALRKELAQCLV